MIRFDRREKDLIARWEEPNMRVETLPLGDVVVGRLLIERKAAGDLAASIKDGRWRDQKARLLQQTAFQPLYVVEGPLTGLARVALQGAICNTVLRDRIHVLRTRDADDTVLVLRLLLRKVTAPPPALRTLVAKRKRGSNTLQRMLACIPGVSEHIAGVLVVAYGTLGALQRALEADRAAVQALRVSPHRRLGPALTTRLSTHLLTTHARTPAQVAADGGCGAGAVRPE
jgi:ERCC4-type nuclease